MQNHYIVWVNFYFYKLVIHKDYISESEILKIDKETNCLR
jgi:hypothetical protein